jgi:quercetin dioxygenase-like cupin family protein
MMAALVGGGPRLVLAYDKVKQLEQGIIDELELLDLEVEHVFVPGWYIRKLHIPAGCVLTGKIHATEHICAVEKGRILVRTVGEEGVKQLVAGDRFVSQPGVKRVGYALEDTVFVNEHVNNDDTRDLALLESRLIIPEAIGYEKTEDITWHGQQ